jgi:hypothetical protein
VTTIRIHVRLAPGFHADRPAAPAVRRVARRWRRRLRWWLSPAFRAGLRAEQRHWIDPLDEAFVRQAVAPYLINDDTDDSTPAGGGL